MKCFYFHSLSIVIVFVVVVAQVENRKRQTKMFGSHAWENFSFMCVCVAGGTSKIGSFRRVAFVSKIVLKIYRTSITIEDRWSSINSKFNTKVNINCIFFANMRFEICFFLNEGCGQSMLSFFSSQFSSYSNNLI